MKLTYEVPTANLKDLEGELDMAFIIAPQALKDKKYFNFYKELSKKKYTIVDNGAFELGASMPAKDIVKLAEQIGAKEIVVPDVKGSKKKTYEVAEKFFNYLEKKNLTNKFIYQIVPQGKDLDETWYSFKELGKFPYSVLGVTARFGDLKDNVKNEQLRYSLLSKLGREMFPKEIHLLGLVDVTLLSTYTELEIFDKIRSLDTSYPIAKALEGKTFEEDALKPTAHITYEEVMTPEQLEKAKKNIAYMRKALTKSSRSNIIKVE